jgi:hypothetical protein
MVPSTLPLPRDLDERAESLFRQHQQDIHRNTDRLFAALMFFQWSGGILAANWVLPQTWVEGSIHVGRHVWGSVLLGGGIAAVAILFALLQCLLDPIVLVERPRDAGHCRTKGAAGVYERDH